MKGVSEMRRLRLRHHTSSSVPAISSTAADAAPAEPQIPYMLGGKLLPVW